MGSEELPSRWEGVEKRVPARLEDLRGPSDGILALPLHLAWSGMTEFDLGDYRERLMCYQIVLINGQRQDAERYLDPDHLVSGWPDLRRLFAVQLSRAWEDRLPELRPAGALSGPV
ncbi:MAG: hypothetical protein GEU94_03010 [Micromonosporaceae bacterium]|nr:hypothetical protein [Micromonosporaceae bacterium]